MTLVYWTSINVEAFIIELDLASKHFNMDNAGI